MRACVCARTLLGGILARCQSHTYGHNSAQLLRATSNIFFLYECVCIHVCVSLCVYMHTHQQGFHLHTYGETLWGGLGYWMLTHTHTHTHTGQGLLMGLHVEQPCLHPRALQGVSRESRKLRNDSENTVTYYNYFKFKGEICPKNKKKRIEVCRYIQWPCLYIDGTVAPTIRIFKRFFLNVCCFLKDQTSGFICLGLNCWV